MKNACKDIIKGVSLGKQEKSLKSPTVLLSGPVSFVWVLDTEADNLPASSLLYKAQILTFKQNQT